MRQDSFSHRAGRLRWILSDVDGVLTDGRLNYGPEGEEVKSFSVKDGLGIRLARNAGLQVGILSARSSAALRRRTDELGLDAVLTGREDKWDSFCRFLQRHDAAAAHVAYVGDDLPDLPILLRAGLSFAPSDAAPEVRQRVDRVLRSPGGRGAVRELVEIVLKARGQWEEVLSRFLGEPAPRAQKTSPFGF